MADWRQVSSAARQAAALLLRDRRAGELRFGSLLAEHAQDPMLLFERGKAFAKLGDLSRAAADLQEAARRFPRASYRNQAVAELSRLLTSPRSQPSAAAEVTPATPIIPRRADLQRAHAVFCSNEPRAVDFEVAARLLHHALSGPYAVSPTVPIVMLLQSWNFAYYQSGRSLDLDHFRQLDVTLQEMRVTLDAFRRRTIASLVDQDEASVKQLFARLAAVVGRVGAAKVMHLWAPEFFPLWDNPIANAYGLDLSEPAEQYWTFALCVKHQVAELNQLPGVSGLKVLDEYNYCRFTKRWI